MSLRVSSPLDVLMRLTLSYSMVFGMLGSGLPVPVAQASNSAPEQAQQARETPTPSASEATPSPTVTATDPAPIDKATALPTVDLSTAAPDKTASATPEDVKPTPTSTATATPTATETATATITIEPTASPTPTATLTPTQPVTGTLSDVIDPVKGGVVASAKEGILIKIPADAFTVSVQVSVATVDLGAVKVESPHGVSFDRAVELVAHVTDSKTSELTGTTVDTFEKPLALEMDITDLVHDDPTGLGKLWLGWLDEKEGRWKSLDFHREERENKRIVAVFEMDHFTIVGSAFQTIQGWTPKFVQPNVALFNGALTYNYPMSVPPGRGGLTPDLSLSYNSSSVDGTLLWTQGGEVGLGWTLGTPVITRDYKGEGNGNTPPSAKCESPNLFRLQIGGAGYTLVKDPTTYTGYVRYLTLEQSSLYIERHNSKLSEEVANAPLAPNDAGEYWIVRLPSGLTYRFGWYADSEMIVRTGSGCNTTDARAEAYVGDNAVSSASPSNAMAIRWEVDTVWDTHFNHIRYEYVSDKACHHVNYPNGHAYLEKSIYLKSIKYNQDINHLTDDNYNGHGTVIGFTLGDRSVPQSGTSFSDYFSATRCGSGSDGGALTADLLHQDSYVYTITITNENTQVRSYQLGYTLQTNHAGDQSWHNSEATRLLTSVVEFGRGGQYTLPTSTFTYSDPTNNKVIWSPGDWQMSGFAYSRLLAVDNGYGGRLVVSLGQVTFPYSLGNDPPRNAEYLADHPTIYYAVLATDQYDGIHSGFARTHYSVSGACFRGVDQDHADQFDESYYVSIAEVPGYTRGNCPNPSPEKNDDAELAGFQTVTVRTYDYGVWTDPGSYALPTALPLSVVTHRFNTLEQDGRLAGTEQSVEVWNGETAPTLFSKSFTTYVTPTVGSDSTFPVRVAESASLQCKGAGACIGTKTVFSSYDVYGNPTEIREYTLSVQGTTTTTLPYRTSQTQYTIPTGGMITATVPYSGTAGRIWMVDRPITVTVWSGEGISANPDDSRVFGRTSYRYDRVGDVPQMLPSRGDVTEVRVMGWVTATSSAGPVLIAKTWYDTYGNVTKTLDGENRGTTIVYDSARALLPVSISSAAAGVNLTATADYDWAFSLIRSVTDEAGQTTCYTFDPFARLTAVFRPDDYRPQDGCPANDVVFTTDTDPSVYYKYYDSAHTFLVPYNNGIGTGIQPYIGVIAKPATHGYRDSQRQFYDGWGNPIQTHLNHHATLSGVSGEKDIVVNREFDALGRLLAETVPYSVTAFNTNPNTNNPYTTTVPATVARTTNTYNAAGWTLTSTAPNGVITRHYYGIDSNGTNYNFPNTHLWQHAVEDGNGHVIHEVIDGFGRLRLVREFSGTTPATRTVYSGAQYEYDVLDNLTTVFDAAPLANTQVLSHTTVITYNHTGQKIAMRDPDMGLWSYTYDLAGNLRTQTDNRACVTTFGYDNLNRLTSKDYDNRPVCPGTVDVIYTYVPQGTHGAGQRSTMWDGTGHTTWHYNEQGALEQEVRAISATTGIAATVYTTTFDYDEVGRPNKIIYPNGEVVTQTYDAVRSAQVTLLQSQEASYGQPNYALDFTHDVEGRLTHFRSGNNVETTYTYYPWSSSQGGRLQTLVTASGSTLLQNFAYGYDVVGNLTSLTDYLNNNEVLQFTYDALDRLDSVATIAGTQAYSVNVDYQYDRFGNLLQGESGTLQYGPGNPGGCQNYFGQPHAVSVLTTTVALPQAYDCNGNMTSRVDPTGSYTQTWDQENRLTSVTKAGSGTTTFLYDGNGQRVIQSRPDGSRTIYVNKYYEEECPRLLPPIITGPGASIPAGAHTITWEDAFAEQSYELTVDDLSSSSDLTTTLSANATSYGYTFLANRSYRIGLRSRSDCFGYSAVYSTTVSVTTAVGTNTPTPTATRTATPTATTAGGSSLTRQIAGSSDDVNEDGASLDLTSGTVWLGTGSVVTASYTGLRFSNLTIPQGATITSAKLQVYAPTTSWIAMSFVFAAENVGNSATFSASSKPSQRSLTTQTVSHASDAQWVGGTWYDLDEISSVVQPVINRADWASGNALSLILKGNGSAYGRKSGTSYDGTPANAIRLVITYSGGGATPTSTVTRTITPTPTRTNTAVGATPTATRTPTVTATPTRTSTVTATPTATATGGSGTCAVLDSFNRSNGAIGTNWGGNTGTAYYQIASNQLDVVATGDAGPILWSPTSYGSTQQACVKLAAIDANADDIALILKAQSNSGLGNGQMEVLYDPTPGAIRIWTYDSVNDWVQRGADLSASFAAGDTLRVVARANGQVEIYKNSTLLGTRDASAWTYSSQGGYIGLWSLNGPNTVFDDFGGGTYSGAAPFSLRAGAPKTWHKLVQHEARPNAMSRPVSTISLPTGGWVRRLYYYAGGMLVATREIETSGNQDLHYVHVDHLGGSNLTTGSDGVAEQATPLRYTPFGKVRSGAQAEMHTARGYTGQYNDTEIGIMYYNARYYSPYLNRWLQPDTIVPNPGNPQHLNRFSYAGNSPVVYIDPTGHKNTPTNCYGRPDCGEDPDQGWDLLPSFFKSVPLRDGRQWRKVTSEGYVSYYNTAEYALEPGLPMDPSGLTPSQQANIRMQGSVRLTQGDSTKLIKYYEGQYSEVGSCGGGGVPAAGGCLHGPSTIGHTTDGRPIIQGSGAVAHCPGTKYCESPAFRPAYNEGGNIDNTLYIDTPTELLVIRPLDSGGGLHATQIDVYGGYQNTAYLGIGYNDFSQPGTVDVWIQVCVDATKC